MKSVRRNDVRVKFRTGVKIMVVGRNPGSLELTGGTRCQLPERDANFQFELAHRPNDIENSRKLPGPFADTFPGGPHAKTRRTTGFGAPRNRQDFIATEEFFRFNSGVIPGTLRAVRAIFTASAGLQANQCTKLNFVIIPVLKVDLTPFFNEIKQRE